jgi:hypothetical protein
LSTVTMRTGETNVPATSFHKINLDCASLRRLARLTTEFSGKIESHAETEAIRLRKSNHGRLRLRGAAIGIVVVNLVRFGEFILSP